MVGRGAFDDEAFPGELIRLPRVHLPHLEQVRRGLHPRAERPLEAFVKIPEPAAGQQPERFPAGVPQGVVGGKQKGHQVPGVVRVQVGQGDEVYLGEIQIVAQKSPAGAAPQVQEEEPPRGAHRIGRRPPPQRRHPRARAQDNKLHNIK